MLTAPTGFDARVRAHAFRLLLNTGRPVSVSALARSTGNDVAEVASALSRLRESGRVRTDKAGLVIGSCGLSVEPDRHRMEMDGRTFWTWCAYDIIGIMGALKAGGTATSRSPRSGREVRLKFVAGVPDASDIVLFRPDDSFAACCTNTYEEWCPNSNFFESQDEAKAWADEHRISGHALTLEQAAALGTAEWAQLLVA